MICTVFGIGLMIVGSSALVGVKSVDLEKALAAEKAANDVRLQTGEITKDELKKKAFSDDELKDAEATAAKLKESKKATTDEDEEVARR